MTNQESQSPTMFKWLVFVLVLLFVYRIREVFPPFIVGGIIAYLLFPLVNTVNKLNRFRPFRWMNPKVAILFIYLTTAATLGALAYKFGPHLTHEVQMFIGQRHEIVTKLVTQIASGFNLQLNVAETSENILTTIEKTIGNSDELMHLGGLLSHGLLSLLVCIVSSIYFIVDSKRVGKFFLRFVPNENKVTAINMIAQMNLMLSKYVVGQLVLIILMSFVAGLFLTYLKVHYAVVIGILSGIFEIIPVLGPFIAISIAVIVGVSQYGVSIAPWIILFYFVARQLEDYYVIPLIIGRAVELHALAVIFAVLVGETMAGALGMLIAIPVAASVKVILDTFYPPEDHSPVAHEEPNLVARVVQFLFSGMRKRKVKETGNASQTDTTTQPHQEPTSTKHDAIGEDSQKQKSIEWAQNKGHNEDNIIKTMAKDEAVRAEKAELLEKAQLAQFADEKPAQPMPEQQRKNSVENHEPEQGSVVAAKSSDPQSSVVAAKSSDPQGSVVAAKSSDPQGSVVAANSSDPQGSVVAAKSSDPQGSVVAANSSDPQVHTSAPATKTAAPGKVARESEVVRKSTPIQPDKSKDEVK
jgi:predicted PurR-regulated permease PerM